MITDSHSTCNGNFHVVKLPLTRGMFVRGAIMFLKHFANQFLVCMCVLLLVVIMPFLICVLVVFWSFTLCCHGSLASEIND